MSTDVVSGSDRAFLYGDGLFETLRVFEGRPLWPGLHLDRLMLGCERLHIPFTRSDAATALERFSGEASGVLRLSISRGTGPRGYAPPVAPTPVPRLSVSPLPLEPLDAPVDVVFSSVVLASQPLLAGIKHCNRLEQVLAAREARERGAGEALLCNASGLVQCAIAANVFVLRGTTLLTPPIEHSGVEGTRRRLILEHLAYVAGLSCEIAPLGREDCLRADAVILTNSVRGVRAVRSIEKTTLKTEHPAVAALRRVYEREMHGCEAR